MRKVFQSVPVNACRVPFSENRGGEESGRLNQGVFRWRSREAPGL